MKFLACSHTIRLLTQYGAPVLFISAERDSGKPAMEFHPCTTLGDLELLPAELLNEIVGQSDFRSFHVTIA